MRKTGTWHIPEAGHARGSELACEVDPEFEWVADLAKHMKTTGKNKLLRDLLARMEENKEDVLRGLHEYELPARAIGTEQDTTIHELLHKMDNLTLELNHLKDSSKLTDLDTTAIGLSYLGNKRSPFVPRVGIT